MRRHCQLRIGYGIIGGTLRLILEADVASTTCAGVTPVDQRRQFRGVFSLFLLEEVHEGAKSC
jgi:hypothetical protein